ncbi:MAG: methyltransferase domain-containing protein [Cyclobacteriaceae bacterium]|nr:methyltransferase domain-containing protein [Cyclobacteriaceae bacterium]MDW8330782.1 methyltransferase domain-containing protein [Cyclobacteriaceae bacterium]
MSRLSQRIHTPELMDDLTCSGEVVHQTLRELDVINKWLGGNMVTLQALQQILPVNPNRVITIADLGCGSGEMLKRISESFPGYPFQLTGFDANPHIIAYARQYVNDPSINLLSENIFSYSFRKRKFDIVLATLFFHHFTSAELVQIFRQLLYQTRIGIVVNDLHRHPLAYHSIRLLTTLFSRSDMVKYDAPLSVLRGFTRDEIEEIMKEAGIHTFTLNWKWAFRWQVIIRINDLA